MNLSQIVLSIVILNSINNSYNFEVDQLQNLGINKNVYVNDIVIYFNRAFLAIPRLFCPNNPNNPTFVEVPWKEYKTILRLRNIKPIEKQIWGQCDNLQNAVSLAKETSKSKIWILDNGNDLCSAKLIVYSLLQNTLTDQRILLDKKITRNDLTSIIIDDTNLLGEHWAFISAGLNTILVCSLNEEECHHLKLLEKLNPTIPINTNYLALSKTSNKIYLTGTITSEVFLLDFDEFENGFSYLNDGKTLMNVSLLGHKLGPSTALETDSKNGLNYYLSRDYAVVRWRIGEPMTAEHHDVIIQSYTIMPYVTRLFTDSQNTLWALVNPSNPIDCQLLLEDNEYEQLERVVKIMRFNKFLDLFV